MNRFGCATLALLLSGCGPSGTAPDGYVEACYGGDFGTHLAGKTPFISADVKIAQDDWPRLAELLKAAAARRHLSYFENIRHSDKLSMMLVSLCSADGLYLTVDKRDWTFDGAPMGPKEPFLFEVFAYKDQPDWTPLADELLRELKSEWPGKVTTPSLRRSTLYNSLL